MRELPFRLRLLTPCQIMMMVAAMDAADSALLMSSFPAFERSFHMSPKLLGSLLAFQCVAGSVFLPFWGFLLPSTGYKRLLVPAVALWIIATFLTTVATSYSTHAIIRVVNGAALSCATPLAQSLVAQSSSENERGRAFGWLNAAEKLSSIVVGYAVVASGARWRECYYVTIALTFLLLVVLVTCLPIHLGHQRTKEIAPLPKFLTSLKRIFSMPTFRVLVAQGVVGATPWRAMAFLNMMWLAIGFTNLQVARIGALTQMGIVFGSIFGGSIGDVASRVRPNSGRIAVAQFAIFAGIPLWYSWLNVESSEILLIAVGFTFYFFACWVSAACNRPVCAEMFTDESDRANIVAMCVFIEGSAAAVLGGPIVGVMSEWYGYRLDASTKVKVENATALRHSLTNIGVFNWSLCFLLYFLLYRTVPRDKANARLNLDRMPSLGDDQYSDVEIRSD